MKKVKSLLSLILAVLMVAGCMATASAANAELEPNGDAATATEFKVSEEITGKLEETGDVDYFKFTAAKAGNATVTFKHTALEAAATYFTVEIRDASKTITTFTSAGNSAAESAVFSVEKDATYYVIVTEGAVYDPTLAYSVTVEIAEVALSESEPNNKALDADVLEYSPSGTPKEYYGSISAGDEDYYKVTIPANGVINLYLYNYAANAGDYTATLYTYVEVSGVQELRSITSIQIAKDDASKVGASVGVEKGDYYLIIAGVDGSTGSYKTRVLFRNVADVETEINETLAAADVISIGKTYKATLDEATDVDCFKFTVPADNKGYDFAFKSTNAGNWTFEILNSDGAKVVDAVKLNATNDSKTAKAETYPLAAGTYYVKVSVTAEGIHDEGIYELSVKEKAEALDDGSDDNKSLIDRIKELNWGGLADNLAGWFDQINFKGMISSMVASIVKVFTYLGSMA